MVKSCCKKMGCFWCFWSNIFIYFIWGLSNIDVTFWQDRTPCASPLRALARVEVLATFNKYPPNSMVIWWYGMSCARPCALLRGPAFLMPLYHALKILSPPQMALQLHQLTKREALLPSRCQNIPTEGKEARNKNLYGWLKASKDSSCFFYVDDTCQVGCVFSACTMQSLHAGSMPTQMVPHAYAKWKGCLITRSFPGLGAYAGASAGFCVGWSRTSTWEHWWKICPCDSSVWSSVNSLRCSSSLGRAFEISESPRALLVRAALYRDFTSRWFSSSFPSTS